MGFGILEGRRKGKSRVIEQLRSQFPGKWTYDREYYGSRWIGPEFTVQAYSQWSPLTDLGEERYVTVYLRDDTQEHIIICEELECNE